MRDRDNGKNSVLTSQSVTDTLNKVPELHSSPFVSPKEFTMTLNSTNAELAGFDSLEESSFSPIKANARATIITTSNAQSSEACDHQKTARVPNSAPQRRVLPTWTRKAREANKTSTTHVEHPHVQGTLLNHYPLWVCSNDENVRFYNKSRPFRFEAVWLRDESCEGIIKSAWNEGNSGDSVDKLMGKVEARQLRLKTWSRLSFGNIRRLLTQKKKKLAKVKHLSMAGMNHEQVQVTGTTGIGTVIRDSKGMVIVALSERITLPSIVEDVEALACRKAISFSIELGLQDIVFEGDSEIIYKHLVSDSTCMTAFGHII
nr:hypothetical protein CFP56_29268 [Quercus suber]